jgi:hypothetical protein
MGALEGGMIALVVVFFILRHFYLMLRWAYITIRRALGLAPVRPAPATTTPTAASKVRRAQPLIPAPSQLISPQPSPEPVSPQSVSPQSESRDGQTKSPTKITLRPDKNDLVRALIWQEILAPPLSKRKSHPPRPEIDP